MIQCYVDEYSRVTISTMIVFMNSSIETSVHDLFYQPLPVSDLGEYTAHRKKFFLFFFFKTFPVASESKQSTENSEKKKKRKFFTFSKYYIFSNQS